MDSGNPDSPDIDENERNDIILTKDNPLREFWATCKIYNLWANWYAFIKNKSIET